MRKQVDEVAGILGQCRIFLLVGWFFKKSFCLPISMLSDGVTFLKLGFLNLSEKFYCHGSAYLYKNR